MKSFGERISQRRRHLELSQAELGRRLGTSSSVVGRYERGEMTPSVEVVVKLADELATTVSYLVGETEHAHLFEDSAMLRRLNALEELEAEDRERVLVVVDALIRDAKAREAYAG